MVAPFVFSGPDDSRFPCIPNSVFEIEAGYPKFKGSNDGQEAVVKGWVNYDEYRDFIAQVQPPSTSVGGNQIIQYGAQLPSYPYLRLTDWEAEPYPGNAPLSDLDANNYRKHPLMYVTLIFRFVKQQATGGSGSQPNPDPAPFLIHRWSVGGQVLSLDNQGLMWDDIRRKLSGGGSEPFFRKTIGATTHEECLASKRRKVGVLVGQTEKVNAIKLLPHIEHEITWPRVPRPAFTYMKEAVGKVNEFEMTFRTGKVPPECLLFTGARIQETVMSNGETSWELVMSFSERQVRARDQAEPGGWNHFFRSNRPSQVYPFLENDDPDTTFTESLVPGPVSGFSLDTGDQGFADVPEWYSCTGLPGFYRLELNPGDYANPCIKETVVAGQTVGIDLQTGYLDDLAIFERYDFQNLWKPEPITSSPSVVP